MKSKRVFICAVFIILGILSLFILNAQLRFVDYSVSVYAESPEPLNNPYIGWYQIHVYGLSDHETLDLSYIENQNYGPALILLEIDLQNYQDAPLSSKALSQLNSLFSAYRLKGKQLIVRFMYDSKGNAVEHEPKDLSIILTHMSQTAEIINQYTDCVYILQGLFIGAWGELHTSNFTNPKDLLALADHLNAVVDPSVFLAVRTPDQWRTVSGYEEPITPYQAFDGSLPARLGLFNDGLLASDTDLGTYAEPGTAADFRQTGKLDRQTEIRFQNALCNYVPNGGEVVIDNPYNDFYPAVSALADTHISYLNSEYDQAVLDKWIQFRYTEDDPYNGLNGYDYIGRHMGYRYTVRASSLLFSYPWNRTAWISVRLENVGFSPAYRPFDVSLHLKNTETNEEYLLPVDTDTRFWDTKEDTVLQIPVPIHDYPAGTYDLFLTINDPATGFEVFFANEAAQTVDGVMLGSLRIAQFPHF